MTNKPFSDKASETDESSKVIGPRGNWTARISLFVATIALVQDFLGLSADLPSADRAPSGADAGNLIIRTADFAGARYRHNHDRTLGNGASEELKTQNLSVQENLRDAVMESLAMAGRTDRRHLGSGVYRGGLSAAYGQLLAPVRR